MGRLIDADALIEAMGEEPYVWTDSADEIAERNQWLTDMHIIESAPTIDAVEVVRCKDCKYAEVYDGYYTQVCCENSVIGGYGELWSPDDFCSYGERRDHE